MDKAAGQEEADSLDVTQWVFVAVAEGGELRVEVAVS